jgi:hypothetical protein
MRIRRPFTKVLGGVNLRTSIESMNIARPRCPNCSTEYDDRAKICQSCGRERDQRIVDHSVLRAINDIQPNAGLIGNDSSHGTTNGGVPKHVAGTHQSANPSNRANQQTGRLQPTPTGVTYRSRSANSANRNSLTNIYVIGGFAAFILLVLVVGSFRSVYEMTKPTRRPLPLTVVRSEPSEQNQSESDADLEHKRFMRAKNARDLKEATKYSKLLAEKAAEAQQLEEQRLQYEQSERMIQEQWLQYQRSQQTYQVTGSGGIQVGTRGGRYTYTKTGKKRYLPSSQSSSGSSRRRSRRR